MIRLKRRKDIKAEVVALLHSSDQRIFNYKELIKLFNDRSHKLGLELEINFTEFLHSCAA